MIRILFQRLNCWWHGQTQFGRTVVTGSFVLDVPQYKKCQIRNEKEIHQRRTRGTTRTPLRHSCMDCIQRANEGLDVRGRHFPFQESI